MKQNELKPCPFCGGRAAIGRTKKTLKLQYAVGCDNTRCIANRLRNPFVLHYLSETEAAEAWNRRVSDGE
jgi:hypothetical protein